MKKIFFTLILFCFVFSSGAQAQDFRTLTGKDISFEDMIATPRAVLFLWATWCPYCIKEFKVLAKECPYFEGVDLWYINVGESKERVENFIHRAKVANCTNKSIILDKETLIASKFGINALPTFIFLEYGQPLYKSYHLDKKLIKKIFKLN